MLSKNTRIYVVSFEPCDGIAGVGGFDWYVNLSDAKGRLMRVLGEDDAFEHTYIIRRVTLPRDFADVEEVTAWLDAGDGSRLIATPLQEIRI